MPIKITKGEEFSHNSIHIIPCKVRIYLKKKAFQPLSSRAASLLMENMASSISLTVTSTTKVALYQVLRIWPYLTTITLILRNTVEEELRRFLQNFIISFSISSLDSYTLPSKSISCLNPIVAFPIFQHSMKEFRISIYFLEPIYSNFLPQNRAFNSKLEH